MSREETLTLSSWGFFGLGSKLPRAARQGLKEIKVGGSVPNKLRCEIHLLTLCSLGLAQSRPRFGLLGLVIQGLVGCRVLGSSCNPKNEATPRPCLPLMARTPKLTRTRAPILSTAAGRGGAQALKVSP